MLTSFFASTCARAENTLFTDGVAEYRTGKYREAVEHLSKAVSADFNNATIHYYLGSAYVRLKQTEPATREFRIAFALQPDDKVGRLSRQALALLGVETGTDVDVTTMFIVPPAPKPQIAPDVLASGGPELTKLLAKLQTVWVTRIFSPPNGGAAHSVALQALGPEWRVGETFDDSQLPACKCDGPWFRIPNWLAGTWSNAADTITQTLASDYKAKTEVKADVTVGRTVKPERWGVVCDHRGSYWEHPCVPNVTRKSARNGLTVDVAIREIPVESTTQRVVVYTRWLNFSLQSDFKINTVTQCEEISTYVPLGSGYCQKTDSLKEFNALGEQTRLTESRYNLRLKKAPIMPLNDGSGRDYLAMFRKYLTDNQMLSLMP